MPDAKIRIIGGQWRGRKLAVADADGLRPTGDRMRETLFNWLAPWIQDARVLDAFAGTGALGLEALSRGARSCDFVENNARTATALRQNLEVLKASARMHVGDFLHWQPNATTDHACAYDIVMIDPPFAANLWQSSIDRIQQALRLNDEAHIYIEHPKQTQLTVPANWRLSKQKTAGQITASLFQLCRNNDDIVP